MNIADTIKNASDRGAHRPFHKAHMIKQPVKPTDPDTLEICNDPLPAHRASPGNKYAAILLVLKIGQAIKCKPEEVGRVSGAMRKHIDAHKIKATVRSSKNYGDGKGRVWMLAIEDAALQRRAA